MARAKRDESAPAARVLSWAYLLAFIFLAFVARAFYSSQGVPPSAQFEVLVSLGLMTLLWYWVKCQGSAHGTAFPMDVGMFLGTLYFFAIPFLLWRHQRWRSVAKTLLLVSIWCAGYGLSLALHFAIVALQ